MELEPSLLYYCLHFNQASHYVSETGTVSSQTTAGTTGQKTKEKNVIITSISVSDHTQAAAALESVLDGILPLPLIHIIAGYSFLDTNFFCKPLLRSLHTRATRVDGNAPMTLADLGLSCQRHTYHPSQRVL